ncbi:MAG: hypothetical protein RSA10_01955 [Bacilli bacterium]
MKNKLKYAIITTFIFLVAFIINFNSKSIIETKRDLKLLQADGCLTEWGGTISKIKYGDNNDTGGAVDLDVVKGNGWSYDSKEVLVKIIAPGFSKLESIKYTISDISGTTCTGELIDLDTEKSEAKFSVIFKNDIWKYFTVSASSRKNSNGKIHDFGSKKREIKIDKTGPDITKFEISSDGTYLNIYTDAKDDKSGVGGYYISYENNMITTGTGGKDSFLPLKDLPSNFEIKLEVKDKVGNITTAVLPSSANNSSADRKSKLDSLIINEKSKEDGAEIEAEVPKNPADEDTGKENIAPPTGNLSGNTNQLGTNSEKLTCDNDLKSLINEYWRYVILFAPMLLMVMITIDFVKATVINNSQEQLKKAVNDAIKRTIATVLLLALPLLLSVILGFFGLSVCI